MSVAATDARTAHAAGVQRLLASYRSIPESAAVRLAKPTSNLFRARAKTTVKGLDTSGLMSVIAVDPEARTADVAGMCTYEDLVAATLPHRRRTRQGTGSPDDRSLPPGTVGRPRTFDLADAIGPVVSCARASGLDIRSLVPPGVDVMGRRNCTAQVVLALLDNARQHAPGSTVTLRVGEVDGAVALFVEDRGPGIPAPLRERVFERGTRCDESAGSGLGLCVAKRLMAEQGGTIECRSRRGGGASFVLRFPSQAPK